VIDGLKAVWQDPGYKYTSVTAVITDDRSGVTGRIQINSIKKV